MFDGLKILDLWVLVDALLTNSRLLFPLSIDEQNGAILDRPRRANDRGLTFTLLPAKAKNKLRCELQGSIHRYSRDGFHNADDFTTSDLLTVLDDLVATFSINPFLSRLNNIEFGVNVQLLFPVSRVLDNLISYKYRPFTKEPGDGFDYYQCHTQRYVVKLYNKGQQYGLPANVLRIEVKVLKMEYLKSQGIDLNTLADLLRIENYGALGALLVGTFKEILFDEPTINPATLTARERDLYLKGSNPRFWLIPDDLTGKEYNAHRQQMHRAENKFRALIDQYRQGDNWQSITAELIGKTWERLATVNDELLAQIDERRGKWKDLTKSSSKVDEPFENCLKLTGSIGPDKNRGTVEKCHKLTESTDCSQKGEMSQINPLSIAVICDIDGNQKPLPNTSRGTSLKMPTHQDKNDLASLAVASSVLASVTQTGVCFPRPTATILRRDVDLLDKVERGRKRCAKGSKENQFERAAHNLRNDDSNPRNNLARRLRRIVEVSDGKPLPLFAPAEVIRLTPDQRTALDYWKGTPYEVRL